MNLAAFRQSLRDLRHGLFPASPRYLGGTLRPGQAIVPRRDDSEPGAPASIVLRRDDTAQLDVEQALAVLGRPASSGGASVLGWKLVARTERQDIGEPPTRAVTRALNASSATDLVVVLDAAYQVVPGEAPLRLLDAVGEGFEIRPLLLRGAETVQLLRALGRPTLVVLALETADLLLPALLDALSAPDLAERPAGISHPVPSAAGVAMGNGVRILAVCTEWVSRNGGISTFNRGLCRALAEQGAHVECLVGADEDAAPPRTVGGSVTLTRVRSRRRCDRSLGSPPCCSRRGRRSRT